MKTTNFSTSFLVDQTAEEAFGAINNVRGWWTGNPGIEGSTDKLGDEFTYRYEPYHFSKQKITEFISGKKVVWNVTESNLSFVDDKSEWTGTKIIFDISKKGEKTEVRFTHQGLAPGIECYEGCSNAWGQYINGSLFKLLTTRIGKRELI
jgi:Activator of Hsp90 ATPase homolog 1-like protein